MSEESVEAAPSIEERLTKKREELIKDRDALEKGMATYREMLLRTVGALTVVEELLGNG